MQRDHNTDGRSIYEKIGYHRYHWQQLLIGLIGGWAYAQKASAKTLDVGIATPLTGPAAHLGTNIKNAALMAIDDQNAQGG